MGQAGDRMYEQAMRNMSRSMESIVMNEFQNSQESVMRLVENFGDLADELVDDFGCSEDCFEACAVDTTTYNGQTFTALKSDDEILQCSITTCCEAMTIVSAGMTQTNMQCSVNRAKQVQCFSADL
jgi:hypothetical protein